MTGKPNTLALVPAGVDTYRQPVIYMREDCHLCRSQGFTSHTRIEVEVADKRVIATLNIVIGGDWLPEETAALSDSAWEALAMRDAGARLDWGKGPVLDKHCVGGLPGNRTTPLVVAMVAAAGHLIPTTSSRAITSPAGTADTMEVMAPVALDLAAMRRVVGSEGGCVVWGGGLDLSPADDILIRIERPLDFDSQGQMVASILSKKAAAGSGHVLIDMPVGPTSRVRSADAAKALLARLKAVAAALEQSIAIHLSDGSAPVGRGIGPALEAHDILTVLAPTPEAPVDLRERALDVAGALLNRVGTGGRRLAKDMLDSGKAEAKFMAICEAQGGFTEPGIAPERRTVTADRAGTINAIDNRRIAKIAKLAGAPGRKTSGVLLQARVGDGVEHGQPLFEVHAESPGELAWAPDYAASGDSPFRVEEPS